jgi:hypothetical protein
LGKIEEAEDGLMEKLSAAKLTVEEYRVVARVGLAAVNAARKLIHDKWQEWQADRQVCDEAEQADG